MTTYLLIGTKIIWRKKSMKPGRPKKLENMTAAEIQAQLNKIAIAKEAKRKEEAASLRAAIIAIYRQHGFEPRDIKDLISR
jgi:hypothetical protein